MDIELLLAHANDHRPVLEDGLSLESAGISPDPPELVLPEHLRYDSRDADSLALQRWGVIVPEGAAGEHLLGLIEPLRRAREQAQGAPARIYRVRAGMSAREAATWKDTVYWDDKVPEEELPRYLLILGDLDQVSLALQQVLANDIFVGRLALREDRDYRAYVDKVLQWERATVPTAEARALFCTVRDGTPATRIGDHVLMDPTVSTCRARKDAGLLPVGDIVTLGADGPSIREFLDALAHTGPGMLFTISHGLGAPRGGWGSVAEQRALQGAMSFGQDGHLAAEHVIGRPFLPGGIWFFLACYSGATPPASSYYAWLKLLHEAGLFPRRAESVLSGLPRAGEQPFVSALPQAALANPEGPQAVVAHADLAWTYSFQDIHLHGSSPSVRNRPSRFQAIFRSILDGCRAGVAYHELLRYLGEASTELAMLYDDEAHAEAKSCPPPDGHARKIERASLFMLRNDLAGYILLGDPAVRLPLAQRARAARATAAPAAADALQIRAARLVGGPPAASMAGLRQGLPDTAVMEEAVLALLRGDESERSIASRAGITRAELSHWVEIYKAAGRSALEKLRR